METEFTLKNTLNGVEEDVLALSFAPDFVVVATATQAVRFEKSDDGLVNADFTVIAGRSAVNEAVVEEEVTIEEEVADVVVDANEVAVANDATIGIDTATEGNDTTETVSIPEGSIAKAEDAVTTE